MIGRRTALGLALLCGALGGCCGDLFSSESCSGETDFTNDTPYYVHFITSGDNWLWVAPGASFSDDAEPGSGAVVIAPGQGAGGRYDFSIHCCEDRCGGMGARMEGTEFRGFYGGPECSSGSCPYVYAHDGRGFVREGEALAGALNRGGRRRDVVPLVSLRPRDGRYRVRLAAELFEDDFLDDVALDVVDHPPDVEVHADARGRLLAVADLAPPRAVLDAGGADRRAEIAAADARAWEGIETGRTVGREPRDWIVLEFPRPAPGAEPVLVVRGHITRFLQDTYHAYMARYGPGLPKLMRWPGWPMYRSIIDRLLRTAGFPLEVAVERDGSWSTVGCLGPFGPAGHRSTALRFAPPAGDADRVRIRLAVLPGAWTVDSVRLGTVADTRLAVRRLTPAETRLEQLRPPAGGGPPTDVADGDAVAFPAVVPYGHALDVTFRAPPSRRRQTRSFFLVLDGYYQSRDRSPRLCVHWRRLLVDVARADAFSGFVLERLAERERLRGPAPPEGSIP